MRLADDEIQSPSQGPGTSVSDPLVAALQALYRAYQKHSMYPSGHPSVPEAVGRAMSEFERALSERRSVLVGVTEGELMLGAERIGEGLDTLGSLARLLHEIDVAAVEFHAGLSKLELENLVDVLSAARRDHFKGADVVDALIDADVEHVRMCPIDYRALSFGEGVQDSQLEAPENMWERLSRVLTDPNTYVEGASARDLAADVTEKISSLEGAGVGGLRSEIHRQLSETESMAGRERSALRGRMAAFVNALNPDLRRNLLQVGPNRPAESLNIMAELADSIPPRELLEALQNVDRVAGQAHDEVVLLLNKLVKISQERPPVASQIEATLDRWGVSSDVLRDPGQLRSAVEEVFQRRTDDQFNPSEYQSLLSQLAQEDLSGNSQPSMALYRDPQNATDVRMHSAEIAVQLLNDPGADEFRPSLLGYVDGSADLLLEHGKLEAVHDATVVARADRLAKSSNEQLCLACDGFLREFTMPERIARLIEQARRRKGLPEEGEFLLDLGGETALHLALDALDDNVDDAVERSLGDWAARQEAEHWSAVVPVRAGKGWAALKPVFPVLQRMRAEVAVPLLKLLLTHEESRVRCNALLTLCDVDDRSTPERYLTLALSDGSPRVVATALRRLALLETPSAMELLGSYAACDLPGVMPSIDALWLTAVLLWERGESGRLQLCDALDSLRPRTHPRRARRARVLADFLQDRPQDPQSHKTLRRWRYSPSWLISRLLPHALPQRGSAADR